MKHYLIIGGGIIGSAVAREILFQGKGKVTVLEKEDSLGKHGSGRNSGVLHSGINQKSGTLKARMCVEGNKLAVVYCKEHGVKVDECGTLVIARNSVEESKLEQLLTMGKEAGVRDLQIISREELQEREPAVVGSKALLSPHGAVVDSVGFLKAVAAEAQSLGAQYHFNTRADEILFDQILTKKGTFYGSRVINCAGLYSDIFAHQSGVGKRFSIIPFRGEYQEVRGLQINSMVYQIPDLRFPFLGVHFTRTIDGKVLAGPNATLSLGRESYEKQIHVGETTRMLAQPHFWALLTHRSFFELASYNLRMSLSKNAFLEEIQSLAPSVKQEDITPYRAGIRAQMVNRRGRMVEDLVVESRKYSTHVLNVVSPGMTTSLAVAGYIVNQLE